MWDLGFPNTHDYIHVLSQIIISVVSGIRDI